MPVQQLNETNISAPVVFAKGVNSPLPPVRRGRPPKAKDAVPLKEYAEEAKTIAPPPRRIKQGVREQTQAVVQQAPPEPVEEPEIDMAALLIDEANDDHQPEEPDEHQALTNEQPESFSIDQVYHDIFTGELRETTKQLLIHSVEGKSILDEINSEHYSNWEKECLTQLRQAVGQYQGKLTLEIKITQQPTHLLVEVQK